jgi:hypothetical protein
MMVGHEQIDRTARFSPRKTFARRCEIVERHKHVVNPAGQLCEAALVHREAEIAQASVTIFQTSSTSCLSGHIASGLHVEVADDKPVGAEIGRQASSCDNWRAMSGFGKFRWTPASCSCTELTVMAAHHRRHELCAGA